MKRRMIIASMLIVSGLAVGCFSSYNRHYGQPLEASKISQIVPDQTTSVQIIQWFGSPMQITESGDDDLYIYKECDYRSSGAGLPFIYGQSTDREECNELTVVVNRKSGIVRDYSYHERPDK